MTIHKNLLLAAASIIAFPTTAWAQASNPQTADAASSTDQDDIVVTAQKREQRLLDVPVPVTALNTDQLSSQNLSRLQDYFAQVPGLNVSPTPSGGNQQVIAIRGITTGAGTNPTVGVVVDDVPYGSATNTAGGNTIPDIDPSELSRIEVLRGPQGTLYGASSMGGLIKFVTRAPSFDRVSGSVAASISSVRYGSDPGYSIRGGLNLPLASTAAIRISGFHREDAGYIDNVFTGQSDLNRSDVSGGRASLLWSPSDRLSFTVGALYQRNRSDGSDSVENFSGRFTNSDIKGTGGYDIRVQAYNASARANLGTATLTALLGYNVNQFRTSTDYTPIFGPAVPFLVAGADGAELVGFARNKKFTQEVRLAVPLGGSIDWLVGGFHARETYSTFADFPARVAASGAVVGDIGGFDAIGSYEESAVFTNLTFRPADRFEIQLGGRQSNIRQSYGPVAYHGPLFATSAPEPRVSVSNNVFTYLVTPQYKITDDIMVYARFASGFRPGVPNSGFLQSLGIPAGSRPDRTRNYELGLKGAVLDRTITFDLSLYRVDWQDVQLRLGLPGTLFTYNDNGNRARSQGVELAVNGNFRSGTTIGASVTWANSDLVDPLPAQSDVRGFKGDPLPLSSRFTGSFTANQDVELGSGWTGFFGGTITYVGKRFGPFQGPPQSAAGPALPRQIFPAYTKLDLNLGVRSNEWRLSLFATNLTNERGLLGGGIGTFPPSDFTYIRPRTIGLAVSRDF